MSVDLCFCTIWYIYIIIYMYVYTYNYIYACIHMYRKASRNGYTPWFPFLVVTIETRSRVISRQNSKERCNNQDIGKDCSPLEKMKNNQELGKDCSPQDMKECSPLGRMKNNQELVIWFKSCGLRGGSCTAGYLSYRADKIHEIDLQKSMIDLQKFIDLSAWNWLAKFSC